MGPTEILVSGGVAAVLAAVVGGGLKAFGIELPLLASVGRQALLMLVGVVLILLGFQSPRVQSDDARQAGEIAGSASAFPQASRFETMLLGLRELTPVSTLAQFESVLGPASKDAEIYDGVRSRLYGRPTDELLVQVTYRGGVPKTLGVYTTGQRPELVLVPTLDFGAEKDGRQVVLNHLGDWNLGDLASICREGAITLPGGFDGGFAMSPCYFGRPGSYHFFAFFYEQREAPQGCNVFPLGGKPGVLTEELVRKCNFSELTPVGAIIATQQEDLEIAVDAMNQLYKGS